MGIGWGTPIERPEGSENGNRVARPTRSRCAHIPTPGAPPSGSRGPFLGVWGAAPRAITVTEHPHLVDIDRATSRQASSVRLSRRRYLASITRENPPRRAWADLCNLKVVFGSIPGRFIARRAQPVASHREPSASKKLSPHQEYLFNNRYPPGIPPIIDQVRGVRLGTPRGIDPQ